ncbi:tetratricopeptide repeat protein [Lutibacter sp.]|uniref:tetratricopeptide repeat protein n=1 Tax=Lutibacter sp. TaxID=1925666 RepID=UPI0034A043C1
MNLKKLHNLFLIGIALCTCFSYAQNLDNQEVQDLKFQEYFFEALKQTATNNYSKAIENLEKCAAIDTVSLAVDFEFSKNYLHLKKYYEAEVFINNALAKDPENQYLLKHKVSILKAERNYKDAIETQKQLVKIKPIYTDELVLLYIQNREFSEAENLITEIEDKALTTLKIRRFKTYLTNRKKLKKKETKTAINQPEDSSIEALKNSFKKNKDFKTLLKILSYELENNLFELLQVDSKNALELFPAQPILYQLNGYALNKLKKYNDAIDVLTIGIDFVIDNNEMELNFYNQLIISYEGLNNTKEVLKYKQKAAQLKQAN